MKKILIAFAALMALAACNNKQAAAPEAEYEIVATDEGVAKEVAEAVEAVAEAAAEETKE